MFTLQKINQKLDLILQKLDSLSRGEKIMTQEISDLIGTVTNLTTVKDSVLHLVNAIPNLIANAVSKASSLSAEDRAAILQVNSNIKADADAMAAAVTANTLNS